MATLLIILKKKKILKETNHNNKGMCEINYRFAIKKQHEFISNAISLISLSLLNALITNEIKKKF